MYKNSVHYERLFDSRSVGLLEKECDVLGNMGLYGGVEEGLVWI